MPNTISKTINPQLLEVSFVNSTSLLTKYSNYLDLVSSFKDELEAYFRYDRSLYDSDFISSLTSFYGDLNNKYKDFDNEFIIYYIKKYNTLSDEIKKAVASSISKQNFLTPLSDSIGLLTNTETILTDWVIPISDVNVSTYPAPYTYPSNLKNKIRTASKNIATDLSKQTTTMFRNNIANIQFVYATTEEAHGSNLITDFKSYIRARSIALNVTQKLSIDFGNVFKLVSYYSNLNDYTGYNPGDTSKNLQYTSDVTYNLSVEGVQMQLDLLGKQINAARKDITIKQLLAVSSQSAVKTPTQLVSPIGNISSNKPVPLNTTAPINTAITNNLLKPNTTITQTSPSNNTAPTPVGYTDQDRKTMIAPVANATKIQQALKTPPISSATNVSTSKVSTQMPEFPRIPFPSAPTSPFGAINLLKSVICTLKNLSVNGLSNTHLPKLSDLFSKPNFGKIKNKINALIIQAEAYILAKILALLPKPWPIDLNAIAKALKKKMKEFLKQLFTCNPDNKL
jgi:hypothetical protein